MSLRKSYLKTVSENLFNLADIIEKASIIYIDETETIQPKKINKKASSIVSIYDRAKKFVDKFIPDKYYGTENSRLNLKTASQESLPTIVNQLKNIYLEENNSKEGIKILNVEEDLGSFIFRIVTKDNFSLDFILKDIGNGKFLIESTHPIFKKVLWKCHVSNTGHIANVLNSWAEDIRILFTHGELNDLKIKIATTVQSPLFENTKSQQPTALGFMEVPASQIIPDDKNWLKNANSKDLISVYKNLENIKKSLGNNNYQDTKKWANEWQQKIINQLKFKRKNANQKQDLKKQIQNHLVKLKRLIKKYKN